MNECEIRLIINHTMPDKVLHHWIINTLNVTYVNIVPYNKESEHDTDAEGEITIIE